MKAFLEEYGLMIVAVIVIGLMLLAAEGMGTTLTQGITDVLNSLMTTGTDFLSRISNSGVVD